MGPEIESVYHYSPGAWGNGYGTEAAIAVLRRAFGWIGLERVIALVMPEDLGSWHVVERLGMRFEGLAAYFDIAGLRKYVAGRAWWNVQTPITHTGREHTI